MVMQVAALDILTTQGGFAPAVACAIGEAMILQIKQSCEGFATSQQLVDTRTDLEHAIDRLRMDMERRFVELEGKLVALEHRMDAKIAAVKSEILRWMFVAMTGQTVVLIGLMRLFVPHGP